MTDILMVVGFIAITLVIYRLIGLHRGRPSAKGEYDERQQVIRGRGHRLGFYLYMIEFVFLGFMDGVELSLPVTSGGLYALMFLLPIGAFVIYCIAKDAYIGIRNDRRRFMILCGIVAAANAASTIAQIGNGSLVRDGKLTGACISPALAVLFLVILIALWIRGAREKTEE